jgi:hypothetical protein
MNGLVYGGFFLQKQRLLYLKEINEIRIKHTTPNKLKAKYDHVLECPHATKTMLSPGCLLT